jgi:hypothetical protein
MDINSNYGIKIQKTFKQRAITVSAINKITQKSLPEIDSRRLF